MTEEKTFVDLVLERMDTNPEEFVEGSPKFRWEALVHSLRATGVGHLPGSTVSAYTNVLWALTEDEVRMLAAKYIYVYREFLRREFVKNIMDEPNTLRPRLLGSAQAQTYAIMKQPSTIITSSTMRAEAERVLQQAIDREAREGNWGAVSKRDTGKGFT